MLVVRSNDLLGRMLVGIGRAKLHYQSRHKESADEPDHDCPMMSKVVGKKSRPDDVEDEHCYSSNDETGEDSDDWRDEQPLLDVARVSCRQVFIDQRRVLS